MRTEETRANIAVIGAGWWSQGWHLPSLHRNPRATIAAIVDTSAHPKSPLNPNLEPLAVLQEKYQTRIFSSVEDLLKDPNLGPFLDGVIIATPHATHYTVARQVIDELDRRQQLEGQQHRPLHILMEKPMSTDIQHALALYRLIQAHTGQSQFWVNHSANYRIPPQVARQAVTSGRIGRVKKIMGFFASPLNWIFEDPANTGWNVPSQGMLGNGFAWGQSSHLLAWIFHVCPHIQPIDVFCSMIHSETTGADVAHSATIRCRDETNEEKRATSKDDENLVLMNISGTSMLPGNAHSDPPVGKQVRVKIFGTEGSILFNGEDRDPESGRLELRRSDGSIEVLYDKFEFENLDHDGLGPESLQSFVQLCCGDKDNLYVGANVVDGLRSVQTIEAMYRSHQSFQPEKTILPE